MTPSLVGHKRGTRTAQRPAACFLMPSVFFILLGTRAGNVLFERFFPYLPDEQLVQWRAALRESTLSAVPVARDDCEQLSFVGCGSPSVVAFSSRTHSAKCSPRRGAPARSPHQRLRFARLGLQLVLG